VITSISTDLLSQKQETAPDWLVAASGASATWPDGMLMNGLGTDDLTTIMRSCNQSMTPTFFNNCFGWVHTNREVVQSDVAILFCPGLNRDALDSHYLLRLLADAFAAAGYPTMRFHYPGTGDSCDGVNTNSEASEPWGAWLQSIHKAGDWLRSVTGARRLILCGLRIGATLATTAAEQRHDTAGLILLAPVVRGHSYLRQLRIEAQLKAGSAARSATRSGASLEFQELSFSPETVAIIEKVDLRQTALPPGCQVGIFPEAESAVLTDCARGWTQRGADVAWASFSGLAPLLHQNIQGDGLPPDFSAVIDWVQKAVPTRPIPPSSISLPRPFLVQSGWTETPVRFGTDGRLFGMLCYPSGQTASLAMIITNTGVDPHYGFGRFSVGFARRLATVGVASLRLDFAGLGDSIGRPGKENVVSSLFETDRVPDINAAADFLEGLGFRRFAIQGLCSGAYHALQGALADPRIATLMLINLPVFAWRNGDTIDYVGHKHKPTSYLWKLARKDIWKQLLHGELDIKGILRAQRERLNECIQASAAPVFRWFGRTLPQNPAHAAMATLSRRHANTLFLFAPGENGLDVLEQNFGRRGIKLRAFGGASMQVVDGLDHALSTEPIRRLAVERMIDFLVAIHGDDLALSTGRLPVLGQGG
jgi:pimeloyl-ACP methyl ester carboxylesterase